VRLDAYGSAAVSFLSDLGGDMASAKRGSKAKKAAPKKAAPKKAAPKKAAPKKAPAKAKKATKRAAATRATRGVPAGFHTLTPTLVFKDAGAALDWYAKAFGAKEINRMAGPGGHGIMHAEIRIGDSPMFLFEENPMGGSVAPHGPKTTTAGLQVYVSDVDAWFSRAVEAGATPTMPVADQFWGDRMGAIVDPFGHGWMIATRKKDMTTAEMAAAAAEFFANFAKQGPPPAAS
jgi:uncharacterized glyoxalase superfamily protein PhnB